MWVDSHCHLHLRDDDPAGPVGRARAAGVTWMVNPGTDLASSRVSVELATRFPGVVLATAGLHPHDASHWPREADEITALAAGVVAIGECGLDFYRNLSPPSDQIRAFRAQIDLASALDKPLIVHCRDAFTEVFDILEETGEGPRSILHCWTGGPRWTRRFRDLGVTFSFAGPLAFETGDTVRRGAAEAPPDRTMVETDSPYLTPPPDRAAMNEPANVVRVGEALAAVWGMPVSEVAALTTATASRVFRHG